MDRKLTENYEMYECLTFVVRERVSGCEEEEWINKYEKHELIKSKRYSKKCNVICNRERKYV